MLFLVTDAGEDDAPTRMRVGSHLVVPKILEPYGEAGADFMDAGPRAAPASESCPLALATGEAGTVYLCHPFLVHAAQPHRGTRPRFMAQPPLYPAQPITLDGPDGACARVELAIRTGLGR